MKVVIQIVNSASVKVEGQLINKIDKGYLLFVGIDKLDDELIVKKMAKKIIEMRINKDINGKTNLSILDVNGEILSISQFTLCAIIDSRRPSFSNAARADVANKLYELFNEELTKYNVIVKKGVFGADMKVYLENDGPFTIVVTDKDL
ncbi:MAG: D-aminoacyl-tRNA deacylase [Erysipelotrichaceae bacterium]|nr:D-aminoacyl-tRNA deacylase [Erysipelotrichaceae bacterium]